jgi:hypothetical protein
MKDKVTQGPVPDWSNQSMAVAAEEVRILLRGMEQMRLIQQQALSDLTGRQAAAMQWLRGAKTGADLIGLQADLVRQVIESNTRCVQQATATALEVAAELFACSTHLVNTEDAFEAATRLVHR